MRKLISAAIVAGALGVVGCGASPFASEDCIILAMGGNKLCGDDAVAWCQSTEAIRDSSAALAEEYGDASSRASVASSQSVCDDITGNDTSSGDSYGFDDSSGYDYESDDGELDAYSECIEAAQDVEEIEACES